MPGSFQLRRLGYETGRFVLKTLDVNGTGYNDNWKDAAPAVNAASGTILMKDESPGSKPSSASEKAGPSHEYLDIRGVTFIPIRSRAF
jgi:hypothetical protein